MIPTEPTWTPPGPGSWVCDRSHAAAAPTPLYRRIVSEHTEPVYRRVMERFGGAIGALDMQFVNGALYRRLVPLVAPDRDNGTVPPAPVLWLVTRLHPEFRRRERTARHVFATRSFEDDIDHWVATERFEWIDANAALQAIDVAALDDAALAGHLRHLDERLVAGWHRHHELHANDLGPIGDLLVHTRRWGFDDVEVMSLLRGSSPATVDAARHGAVIAAALLRAGVDPATISDIAQIRAVPEASAAADDYLAGFGWRLVSDYDIGGLTLNELPSAVVALVRRVDSGETRSGPDAPGADPDLDRMRSGSGDPALFDQLLASARTAYGVRDDNGPLTWAWPAGLTRRAYLEAGRRLAATGRLDDAAHAFELDIDELAAALEGAATPAAGEVGERAATRRWEATLDAPDVLGPTTPKPDTTPLPPSIRRMMDIILATVGLLDPDLERPPAPLAGLGIGARTHLGTARVVDDAGEAIRTMEPGDVLVAPWTSPSFNAVLSIAGGVVVQEGGLLCHAAVMARELDIPAVIGCREAMRSIRTGDLVEVDPAAGTVRIVATVA
ncbi:MAG: PEP-utilizing enzyme [Acidimicrobiales bacterium]